MLLRLTDGTTTLTLSGSGAYIGATYFPQNQPGGERITETAALILEGTAADIRAAVNAIEQMLQAARGRKGLLGTHIYVEFRPTDSGEIRHSEIFDGYVSWSQVPAERSLYNTVSTVRVVVTWERLALWRGPEVELYLSSAVTAEQQGGVTAYNNDNAGNPNWVGIAAARVEGTRPAPVRLRITNAAGSALSWRTFHVGLNTFSAPASADLWLLGSEATGGATASWAAGSAHNSLRWVFPLSATLLAQAQGRTFRVLAAFDTLTVGIPAASFLRAAVGSYIGAIFVPTQQGNERQASHELLDLGEFSIPPGGYNVANAAAALAITARSTSSGGGTLNFVMLMPTDGYRKLEQIGYTTSNGDSVEDDGVDGGTYELSGSSRYPIIRASGGPLRVYPGRDQRIYILFGEDGGFVAGRQMTIRAWYRPIYDNI